MNKLRNIAIVLLIFFIIILGFLSYVFIKNLRVQNEKDFVASIQNDINSYRRENLAELERIINDTQSNAENLLQKAEVNSGGNDY